MYQIPPTGQARWRLQVSIRFDKMVIVGDLDHCDLNMEDKSLLELESETVETVIWATLKSRTQLSSFTSLLRSFSIKISKLTWWQEWDKTSQSRTMFWCGIQSACLLLGMIQERRKNWWYREATYHSQNREDPGHPGEAGFRHSRPFITRKKAKGMSQAEATAGLATHWGKYKAVLFWLFSEIKQDHQLGMLILQQIFTPPNSSIWGVCVLVLSHVSLFVIPWAVACQALLSMEFPGKNTRVGSHSLLQGIFLTQGSNLSLPHWQVDPLPSQPPGKPPYLRNTFPSHSDLLWPMQLEWMWGEQNIEMTLPSSTWSLCFFHCCEKNVSWSPGAWRDTWNKQPSWSRDCAVGHGDFVLTCYTVKTDWYRKISAVSRREDKVWNGSLWMWKKELTRGSNRVAG